MQAEALSKDGGGLRGERKVTLLLSLLGTSSRIHVNSPRYRLQESQQTSEHDTVVFGTGVEVRSPCRWFCSWTLAQSSWVNRETRCREKGQISEHGTVFWGTKIETQVTLLLILLRCGDSKQMVSPVPPQDQSTVPRIKVRGALTTGRQVKKNIEAAIPVRSPYYWSCSGAVLPNEWLVPLSLQDQSTVPRMKVRGTETGWGAERKVGAGLDLRSP